MNWELELLHRTQAQPETAGQAKEPGEDTQIPTAGGDLWQAVRCSFGRGMEPVIRDAETGGAPGRLSGAILHRELSKLGTSVQGPCMPSVGLIDESQRSNACCVISMNWLFRWDGCIKPCTLLHSFLGLHNF